MKNLQVTTRKLIKNHSTIRKNIPKRKNQEPLVSIVVPVFNCAQYLANCLDSLLAQSYKNIEIVCIDDASTDVSPRILEFYKNLDSRIRVFTHPSNKGLSASRNTGIDKARGKYICFVDGDDLLVDWAILAEVTHILRTKSKICFFNMEAFDPFGNWWLCYPETCFKPEDGVRNTASSEVSAKFTSSVMGLYEVSLFSNGKNRFPEGVLFEDWIFMSNLLNSETISFCSINAPLYKYRRNYSDQTITSNVTLKSLEFFDAYRRAAFNIKKSPNANDLSLVGDMNFIEQAMSYYESRILFLDNEVSKKFLIRMLTEFQKFPETYFLYLCSNLNGLRYEMAQVIYYSHLKDLNLIVLEYRKQIKKREIKRKFFILLKLVYRPKHLLARLSVDKFVRRVKNKVKRMLDVE